MNNIKSNIKTFLWAKTKAFLWAFTKFLALNLFRAFLLIVGYAFHIVHVLSEWGIKITAFIGHHYGLRFKNVIIEDIISQETYEAQQEESQAQFQQKFSRDDIQELAVDINPDATIKEIEHDLGVSYRQARKIKQAAKNSPIVRNFTVAQLSA